MRLREGGGGPEPDRWSEQQLEPTSRSLRCHELNPKDVCVVEPRASGWPNVVRVDQR